MNFTLKDLKREDSLSRRSSDASSPFPSETPHNNNKIDLQDYHLPHHTSDIKEASPFLASDEDEEARGVDPLSDHAVHFNQTKRNGASRLCLMDLLQGLPSCSRRSQCLLLILVVFVLVWNTIAHPTPNYDLLPPSKYHSIINQAVSDSFPSKMQQRLKSELSQRIASSGARRDNAQGLDSSSAQSLMPSTLFQTDKKASKLVEVERSWDQAGAHRIFLDDKGASEFIYQNFNNSEVWDVYNSLPIPVLKSDFLRYSALLAQGGIYSDMDTRVLMPIDQWWRGSQVFTPSGRESRLQVISEDQTDSNTSSSSTETWHEAQNPKRQFQVHREPVRFLVGIENDSKLWHSVRNVLEALWLLPLNRHRPLQFVQWTLQSAPNHPILVDTLRRIVGTSHYSKALIIEREREANYYEARGDLKKAEKVRKEPFPWNGLRGKEFERTGVEEWTGPGVFTDAVMSYLNAVAGLQISDLQKLKQPLQVNDVVILPCTGFNPFERQLPNPMARVVHLFRGSWK